MSALRAVGQGLAAGVAGTVALDAATYLDMAVRGRPASSLPADAAARLAQAVRLDLGTGGPAANRQEGLGALLGLLTGAAVGAAYGLVRSRWRLPAPVAAVALAGGAMAGANGPLVAMGLTDPRRWTALDWASDVLPHLAYGAVTAAAYRPGVD